MQLRVLSIMFSNPPFNDEKASLQFQLKIDQGIEVNLEGIDSGCFEHLPEADKRDPNYKAAQLGMAKEPMQQNS